MTTSPDLVAVRSLSVRFGSLAALADVSFSVAPGSFVAVIGPSGCGKSTLLRVLAGLVPAGAAVSADEVRVPVGPDGRRATAWMPQGDSLLPWRRALPNALVGARIAGLDRAASDARARALLEEFGLGGFERAWPHELSGGMRQRLALARTCLPGRPVLLLDEPFGALDALTRRRMNAWLASLALAGPSGAVVLVTHDVDEALLLADRVLVMSERPGRVVLDLAVRDRADARDRVLTALGLDPISPSARRAAPARAARDARSRRATRAR
ncbi:ABC transporter ATP-binding protein [Cellulomonas rhizosphaerae]|uniref:ABC transporter ATP-binding protein n=1 Tax=Cellulomonas rhizosphaerae TaxID=2293719 RepID=A0A413RJ92_9CELL|nr:ABC transporter ATP-binding protein [Cellulomonas rhizosphaerae]RHA38609.1 ABC transporter ATP-binding protein [Cellulomonas rhizosphaerae]